MSNEHTIIQFKRYKANGGSVEAQLHYGEPFFDKRSGFLYVGTSENKSLLAMRSDGEYYKRINEQNPIVASDISANAVTAEKIAQNSILTNHIYNGAVTTPKIADGTVTNDKIADNTITYSKLNLRDGDIPYSKIDAPSTFDASMITGRISVDNLPVDYTAPRATSDKYGNDITKNYANLLALETAGGVTRLVLRPLSRYAGDQSNLGAIEPSALAKAIQDYLPQPKLNEFSGSIKWEQIDDPPSTLNMAQTVGDGDTPVYYDAAVKGFVKTKSFKSVTTSIFNVADNKYLSKPSKTYTVEDNGRWVTSLTSSGGTPQTGFPYSTDKKDFFVIASVKIKKSGEDKGFWISGIGFKNSEFEWDCALSVLPLNTNSAFLNGVLAVYITRWGVQNNIKAEIKGATGYVIQQIKYRVIVL